MAGMGKLAMMGLEAYGVGSEYKLNRDKGKSKKESIAWASADMAMWAVAPKIMFAKMAVEMAPIVGSAADSIYKNNQRVYQDELGNSGEIGNSSMARNNIEQKIGQQGVQSIREAQRNLNQHFGDEARRYSRR